MTALSVSPAARVTPGLDLEDPALAYRLAQVNLRLRRELAWCWYQRLGEPGGGRGMLPPTGEAAADALDQIRCVDEKQRFFEQDAAAAYLSAELAKLEDGGSRRLAGFGIWNRVAAALELTEAAQFVFGLALAARLDAALGAVFAACMNDLNRPYATLALAQRLWDDPLAVVPCADPAHPLHTHGLLTRPDGEGGDTEWLRPLHVAGPVAQALLDPAGPLPGALAAVPAKERPLDLEGEVLAQRLAEEPPARLQVVPLLGSPGMDFAAWSATLARRTRRPLVRLPAELPPDPGALRVLAVVAWLRGVDLLLPDRWLAMQAAHHPPGEEGLRSLQALPVRCYVPAFERQQLAVVPTETLMPGLSIPSADFAARLAWLRDGLGRRATRIDGAIEECARRFRFQELTLKRVLAGLPPGTLSADRLIAACRAEAASDLCGLAQPVRSRFSATELVLPPEPQRQFEEIVRAMGALTTVHYHWGTARPWNESGLAVLFCGAPGTGKTMAAEVLSRELDLPMFRVDLSQVVNKYIGETEKNLRRIFDAAEQSDCILFFDEADALFGKRTEVKDAHDRFANIEISYLLERMERFKGLAILATNRRKDLDEAFVRRLRYLIEFPLPGRAERERIWRQGFPPQVDVSGIDFPYLARQFQLAGGHIRSIIFNACLQAAARPVDAALPEGRVGRVTMPELLLAVKRELQKMSRSAGEEQFGIYQGLLRESAS
jgi:hypothetical protein